MLDRVGIRVTTLGKDGVRIDSARARRRSHVPVVPDARGRRPDRRRRRLPGRLLRRAVLGSGARSGPRRSARLLATLVLETVGPQEYAVVPAEFPPRLGESYGDEAAAEVAAHLPA